MKQLVLPFILFFSISICAQDYSKDQLTQDLAQLKQSIKSYNPALENYNPHFDSESSALINGLSETTYSPIAAFNLISKLCALSNEGHFSVGNWQDDAHAGFLDNTYLYLPISIKIISGKCYIWIDNSTEQSFNRGDEIVSINGMKMSEILDIIRSALPTDGDITTYADRNIELGFSWMYYLFVSQNEVIDIEVKVASNEIQKTSIAGLTRKVQFENYDKYYPDRNKEKADDSFYSLTYEENTAFLTLPSFDYRKIEEFDIKSGKFYAGIFGELSGREIENLVIDLRGNTGGRNEMADDMVPFIIQNKPDPFLKKSTSWEGKEKTYKFPKPAKTIFQGQIYVLVDGRTYSAGGTLARYLKEYGNAVIIGEETGSRYEGYAAGSSQALYLPESGVKIGIPRYHTYYPKSEKQQTTNRGLIPDYEIQYSVQDVINGRDKVMEYVLELIK